MTTLQRAEELLEGIKDMLPLKVNEITNPSDDPEIATVRKADGYPAVAPHPESQSMLVGPRAFFTFLQDVPDVLADLIDALKSYQEAGEDAVRPETVSKPNKANSTGVSLPE